MKFSTIVGVYVANHSNPSTLPNNPLCLCLEHQDTEIPAEPFTFPINAVQGYYMQAHCAVCGKYLGLPEDQAPEKRPDCLEHWERMRAAVLPEYERRLLLSVLTVAADYFDRRTCDDLELAELVPELADRRAIMQRFHEWNGDPEVWAEDLARGGTFADCRYWTYGAALAYFVHQLAPDLEQAFRESERDK
jgi:hypothetical protein